VAALTARQITRITDYYAARCLWQQEPPQVNELAAELGMSASEFSDLFLRLLGERPSKYLQRYQIECAKRLLRETDWSTNEIAYRCGYKRRVTFFRAFKRVVGTTPTAYRQLHQR
jgi:AraC-like DNA-binding protein